MSSIIEDMKLVIEVGTVGGIGWWDVCRLGGGEVYVELHSPQSNICREHSVSILVQGQSWNTDCIKHRYYTLYIVFQL